MSVPVQRNDPSACDFYMAKQPWVKDSACLASDPDTFFYENFRLEARTLAIRECQRICAKCPVRMECAEQAMLEEGDSDIQLRFGFRAYMTPEQRVSIHRRGGLLGRDPMKLVNGVDGKRSVPPVPIDGDKWSRHHTTLARKVVKWVVDNVEIGEELPTQAELCRRVGSKPDPMKRVLTALVQDGTLDFSGREGRGANAETQHYVRRGAPRAVASWLPLHLRHTTEPKDVS